MTTADSRLARIVVAALIGFVLIADAAVVGLRQGGGTSGPSANAADKPANKPANKAAASALEAALPELVAFVEDARGQKFLRQPKVQLLDDKAFEAKLTEGEESNAADEQAFLGVMRALGLIEGDVDLQAVADNAASNVVGFYDSHTKVLYARGAEPTPYVKSVLVHELTHALDDQRFQLDRPQLNDDSEASAAFDALVEGSAMVVEERWYDSRSPGDQAAIDAADSQGAEANANQAAGQPDVFEQFFAFPYQVGPVLVHALVDNGGNARLDEAFRNPPISTEQVIHPDRYLAGDAVKPVDRPAADGPVVDEDVIGELGLILLLDSATTRAVALRAAAGWGGDKYVAWTSGAKTCVRFNMVMDTAQDTTELLAALRTWAGNHPGATVKGTGPVTVTNCA